MRVRPIGSLLALGAVAVCALAAGASAKEGFVATLTSPIPADARPGTTLYVAWTISRPAAHGAMPFNATDVFVRLRNADGAASEGYATFKAHTDGAYRAQVTVPSGGISSVEIGVAGTRTYSSGKSERADLLFPITNPPALAGSGSGSGGIGTLTWLVPLLAGAAVVALVVLAARRRIARPQLGT
jgi:hypothetical protein